MKSLTTMRSSFLRERLRASVSKASAPEQCRGVGPTSPASVRQMSSLFHCDSSRHSDEDSARLSPLRGDTAAARRPPAKTELSPPPGVSLFEELAATAAKDRQEETPAAGEISSPRGQAEERQQQQQLLLQIIAASLFSLEELQGKGVSAECLLQISRIRKTMQTKRETAAIARLPVSAPAVPPLPPICSWLSPLSLWLRASFRLLLNKAARCCAAPVCLLWRPAENLLRQCLLLETAHESARALLLLSAMAAGGALGLRLFYKTE